MKNKTVGLCHGVFDIVHLGHINHFKKAKSLCDYLVVSITKDKFIKKGLKQPLFDENQRLEYLKSLKIINEVYLCKSESAEDSIKKFKPNFYFKGPDYKINKLDKTKKIYLEKKLVNKFKGKIIYTDDKKYSSTKIMNFKSFGFDENQSHFLDFLKKKYSYDYINSEIKKLKTTKTLVMGEFIIDNYCYGNAIGKAAKEPHLVMSRLNEESYVGGAGAIAKNISDFTDKIKLITEIGKEKKYHNFIHNNLSKNINTTFYKPYKDYKTIIKTRFIDKLNNYKLFGYYELPENKIDINKTELFKIIKSNIKNKNLLIIADFGHNFFNKKIINLLNNLNGIYKTVNVQFNSANNSFQTLKKFNNFDAMFVNEGELRQEFRDNDTSIEVLGKFLKKERKIDNIIITRGKRGALMIDKKNKEIQVPAFSNSSIDKIGAGDSLFSLTSLALSAGLNSDLSLFLGSLSAAESVKYPGNKFTINQNIIERYISYIYR